MQVQEAERKGRRVIEAKNVTLPTISPGHPVIRDLSTMSCAAIGSASSARTVGQNDLVAPVARPVDAAERKVHQGTNLEVADLESSTPNWTTRNRSATMSATGPHGGNQRRPEEHIGYLEDFCLRPSKPPVRRRAFRAASEIGCCWPG